MITAESSVLQAGALLSAAANLTLGLIVIHANPRHRMHQAFMALALVLAFWNAASYLALTFPERTLFERAAFVGVAFLAPAAMLFFSVFTGNYRPRNWVIFAIVTLLAVLFSAAFVLLPGALIPKPRTGPAPLGHYLRVAFCCFIFPSFSYSLWMVGREMRRTRSRLNRKRLGYVFGAGLLAAVCGVVEFLPHFGVVHSKIGVASPANFLWVFVLTVAIVRHRLFEIRIALKATAFVCLLLGFVIGVIAFFLWVTTKIPEQSSLSFLPYLLSALIILVLYEPVKNKIALLLFRLNALYSQELSEFARRFVGASSPEEVGAVLLPRVAEVLDAEGGVFCLYDDSIERLVRVKGWGSAAPDAEGFGPDLIPALLDGQVFVREEIEQDLGSHAANTARLEALDLFAAEVCVPLVSGDRFLGLFALGPKLKRRAYRVDDVEFLSALAGQVSMCLNKIEMFAAARRRAQLAEMGEMAAGLAHEIKNPLGAIRGAADWLRAHTGPEAAPGPSRAAEFIGIVSDEAKRLDGLLEQFLAYARPREPELQDEDLNQLVTRVAALLEHEPFLKGVALRLDLDREMPHVRLDAEQVRQVLWNLVKNASEALSGRPEGEIVVQTRDGSRASNRDAALLVVADNGPGWPPHTDAWAPAPFLSSRKDGSGLGLAIVQQIVQAHNAKIAFRNRAEGGAEVIVSFPRNPSVSDSQRLKARGPTHIAPRPKPPGGQP